MVTWLGCVTIGTLGLVLNYPRPRPIVTVPPPVVAQTMEVEVAKVRLAPPETLPSPAAPAIPSPVPAPPVIPEAAPLLPVAAPSPAIAFALPVEGPTRVVAPEHAAHVRPPPAQPAASPAPPSAQPLVFGQGEGKQPAPDYPRAAVRAGQEGTVRIGFTVGEDGRILAAEVVAGSPWPLLNEAALHTVRTRWRFTPGPPRRYEVPIRFQLEK